MKKLKRQEFDSTVAQLNNQIQQIERNQMYNNKHQQSPIRQSRTNQLYQKGVSQVQTRRSQEAYSQINRENIELRQCTFNPKTNNTPKYANKSIVFKTQEQVKQKTNQYQEHKQYKQLKEMDKCTFKPQINNNYFCTQQKNNDCQSDFYSREVQFQKQKQQKLQQQQEDQFIQQTKSKVSKNSDIKKIQLYKGQGQISNRLAIPKNVIEINLNQTKSQQQLINCQSQKQLIQQRIEQNQSTLQQQQILQDDNIKTIRGEDLQFEYNRVIELLDQMKQMTLNNKPQKQKQQNISFQETKIQTNQINTFKKKYDQQSKDQLQLDFSCLKTLDDLDIEDKQLIIKKKQVSQKSLQQKIDYSNDNQVNLTNLDNKNYQFHKLDKRVDIQNNSYQLDCSKNYEFVDNYYQKREQLDTKPISRNSNPLQFLRPKQHVSTIQINQNKRVSSLRQSDKSIDFSKLYVKTYQENMEGPLIKNKILDNLIKKSQKMSEDFQLKNNVELSSMV